ncbi:MAG: tRNA (adenine-N1)-methyltransferase [Candidatus Hadarchaeales archaeon]
MGVKEGERVILLDERGKKYLVRAERKLLHTDLGLLNLAELLEVPFGGRIRSHTGREFVVLKPRMSDFLQKMRRLPQVVLPKDAAQVVAHTGVGPGDLVVDGGTGSGALALFLGNLVRPHGKVVSYEIREDFAEVAKENVKLAGLEGIVEVKLKDMREGIEEREVDLITLDLPYPEEVLPHAEEALKPGGYLAVFTPTIEQVQRLYPRLRRGKFAELKTLECLVREWEVREGCTRPSTRMLAHTSYLTLARRI